MELIKIVDDELFRDGLETRIVNEHTIVWLDSFGAENEIYSWFIESNGKEIAWYQKNEVGRDLLRIKNVNGTIINWRPQSNHSDYGIECQYLKWFSKELILIYREKHGYYIFNLNGIEITELYYCQTIKNVNIVEELAYIETDNNQIIDEIKLTKPFSNRKISFENLRNKGIELIKFHEYFIANCE